MALVWRTALPLCHTGSSSDAAITPLMDALFPLLALTATVLYFLAAIRVARAVGAGRAPDRLATGSLALLGALLHGAVLQHVLVQPAGLHFGLSTISTLHGWLIALLALLVNVWRPVQGIYLVALPLAGIELCLGLAGHSPAPAGKNLDAALQGHVLLSLLAYGVLSIAALQALLLRWQEAALRRHRRGLLVALPALQIMEGMLFELIALGLGLLTLAIVTGFFVLDDLFAQHVAHKTVFSLMAWLTFTTLLAGRRWRGWRGRTAVRITLTGFGLLLLGFVGSQLVLELLLARA